jgi:hypothetical protein
VASRGSKEVSNRTVAPAETAKKQNQNQKETAISNPERKGVPPDVFPHPSKKGGPVIPAWV